MVNTNTLVYDEVNNKIVPSTGLITTKILTTDANFWNNWDYKCEIGDSLDITTAADPAKAMVLYKYSTYSISISGTSIVTYKHKFTVSEFNTVSIGQSSPYISSWRENHNNISNGIRFQIAEDPEFNNIILNLGTGITNIEYLKGSYYIRFLISYYTNNLDSGVTDSYYSTTGAVLTFKMTE